MKRIVIMVAVLFISTLTLVSVIFSYPTHSGLYSMDGLKVLVNNWLSGVEPASHDPSPKDIKVHPWLTLRAIELFEKTYGKGSLSSEQKQTIILGAVEEDFDIEGTSSFSSYGNIPTDKMLDGGKSQSERCMNHFMDINENGLALLDKTASSAGYWAFQDEQNSTRYSEAVDLVKSGQTEDERLRGWRFLGHVLHLLQDMSVPAHVRNDGHPGSYGTNDDNYEHELSIKNIASTSDKTGYYELIPDSSLEAPKTDSTPDGLFKALAQYTRENYVSDDTQDDSPQPSNVGVCEDDSNYMCNGVSKIAHKGVLYKITGKSEFLNIDDKVTDSMFSDLGKKAIEYSAGLIKLFYDTTLSGTYTITGQITCNGSGLAGVTVSATGLAAVMTDANGNFTLTGLTNGNYTLSFSNPGFTFNPASMPVTVTGGDITLTQNILADATIPTSYTIIDLGTLGGTSSGIHDGSGGGPAINNSGQVVGHSSMSDGSTHAFLYCNGEIIDLGTLPGDICSSAWGINDNGQVVGHSYGTNGINYCHAFLYCNGTMTDLGTLGGSRSTAYGINNNGQVVGESTVALNNYQGHAFLYSDETMIDLGTLGGTISCASAINDNALVVGISYTSEGNPHAFLYNNSVMTDLCTLSGDNKSDAYGINNIGQIVGISYAGSLTNSFLYTSGTMINLGNLLGYNSIRAVAINNNGQIVGFSSISDLSPHGFLYSGGSMVDLETLVVSDSDWSFLKPAGINDRGQIVGTGTHNGVVRAFLMTPVNTP